jgi:serine acetyltransferase
MQRTNSGLGPNATGASQQQVWPPSAMIPGDISVGDFARIGAGALVEPDVPAGCTAVGVPARLVNCAERGCRRDVLCVKLRRTDRFLT